MTSSDKPHDRLTDLGASMLERLLDELGEDEEVWAIVMLSNKTNGGIATHGYEKPEDCLGDLFVHANQIAKTVGKRVALVKWPQSPEGGALS